MPPQFVATSAFFIKAVAQTGAPRTHDALRKFGLEVSHFTVSRYLARRASRPAPRWKAYLHDHAIAAMFAMCTAGLEQLYTFVVGSHGRRESCAPKSPQGQGIGPRSNADAVVQLGPPIRLIA